MMKAEHFTMGMRVAWKKDGERGSYEGTAWFILNDRAKCVFTSKDGVPLPNGGIVRSIKLKRLRSID